MSARAVIDISVVIPVCLMADISVKNYYGTNGRRNYSIEKIVKK